MGESGDWINRLNKHGFRKPDRFGSGRTMTLGIYDSENITYVGLEDNLANALKDFNNFVSEIK